MVLFGAVADERKSSSVLAGKITRKNSEPGGARGWHDWQGAKFARFGDNMPKCRDRGDKWPPSSSLVTPSMATGRRPRQIREHIPQAIDKLVQEYAIPTRWPLIWAKAAPGTIPCVKPPASSLACALLKAGDFKALPHVRRFAWAGATAGISASGSWRWLCFGAEGDWKTAACCGMKIMAVGCRRHLVHGGLHVSSRSEGQKSSRRAHAGNLPVHCRRKPSRKFIRSASAARRPGAARLQHTRRSV